MGAKRAKEAKIIKDLEEKEMRTIQRRRSKFQLKRRKSLARINSNDGGNMTKVVPTGGSPDGSESAGDSESILYPEEEDDFSDLDHEDELPPVNKKKNATCWSIIVLFQTKKS